MGLELIIFIAAILFGIFCIGENLRVMESIVF